MTGPISLPYPAAWLLGVCAVVGACLMVMQVVEDMGMVGRKVAAWWRRRRAKRADWHPLPMAGVVAGCAPEIADGLAPDYFVYAECGLCANRRHLVRDEYIETRAHRWLICGDCAGMLRMAERAT